MLKNIIIFILKLPFYILRLILRIMKWILKHVFGFIFGWIPDLDERMSGEDFEEYVKEILIRNGHKDVQLTKRSGDFGIDILSTYKDQTYAIQCKFYARPVGVAAIQQASSGCVYYDCDQAVVVTNNRFTSQAITLALTNDVELWDKDTLKRMQNRANSKSILKRYKRQEESSHQYDDVLYLLLNEGYASSLLLEEHLHYSHEKAYYILEDLAYHDLVSKEDDLGIRDVYFLSYEEAAKQLS